MIIFDHSKLDARIHEMFGSFKAFGSHIGMSEKRISVRVRGITKFSQPEMNLFIEALKIQPEEIQSMFFEIEVCR